MEPINLLRNRAHEYNSDPCKMSYASESEPLLAPSREVESADDGGQKQRRVKFFFALLTDSIPGKSRFRIWFRAPILPTIALCPDQLID
jgi:hypothetical protein